jgi:hypothetical protein
MQVFLIEFLNSSKYKSEQAQWTIAILFIAAQTYLLSSFNTPCQTMQGASLSPLL